MPRRTRKKKSQSSQWPPLRFVSSPLFQPAPVLEQEMAATNPVTAKTVPIDDLTETVWVSPQFSQLGHRMLRSSLSVCRTANSASKGSRVHSTLNKRSKFKPLRFLCEETSSGETSVCDPKHLQPIRLETILQQAGGEKCHVHEGSNAGQNSEMDIEHSNLPTKHVGINKENTDQHSAALSTPVRANRVLRSGRCDSSGSICKTKRTTHSSERINFCNVIETGAPYSKADYGNSTDSQQYQTTDDSLVNVPCPASFVATPSRVEFSADEQLLDMNEPQTDHPDRCLSSPSTADGKSSTLTHNCVNMPVPNKDDLACNNNVKSRLGIFSNTNSWLKTPPGKERDFRVVLALDTPECDYGLRLRQRQLKYGLREGKQNMLTKPP
ncbi:hypothetical protein ElyMa_002036300 [Elysia marginata]|uniref:Uncharacterized protein n=1 Tax=Elysia marginata TaxID=1093978 RepID=A0AAV4F8C9_9GAST|nr:hypothetical protein ElyMa_002036300 [Elysia marginata]